MNVTVNGESHEINTQSLTNALSELGFSSTSVAVAINGVFVPRIHWQDTELRSGDQLEVLAPMQGG